MRAVEREYNMSNPELMFLIGDFVAFMNRDSTGFAGRGVDSAAITAFETLGNAFELFPPDEYYSALVTGEVEAKNIARTNSFIDVQKISGFFQQQWGLSSWRYKQLGIKGMINFSDDKFKSTCRNVMAVASDRLANLTAIGLTQSDIDVLSADVQVMEDKGHDAKEAIALRDSKTQERTLNGNELYSYVKQYSTIGKLIWENVDEAKYNDYIIYKTSKSSLSRPQNVAAGIDPLDPSPITLTWDLVALATSYDVYVNITAAGAPAGSYSLLNNFVAPPALIPSIFEMRNYFKIKAKSDTDSSPYSDDVWIDVPAMPA